MAKDGPGGEKTEKPTPQRLKKARKEGQIPRTQELGTWLGVAAASVLLPACAALTKMAYSNAAMAYSNLAPMATWMVDDYVDLQGTQKDWVRERITRTMQWHRSTELPKGLTVRACKSHFVIKRIER